jgi:hypothetical protein
MALGRSRQGQPGKQDYDTGQLLADALRPPAVIASAAWQSRRNDGPIGRWVQYAVCSWFDRLTMSGHTERVEGLGMNVPRKLGKGYYH